jgi:hypothetical protein
VVSNVAIGDTPVTISSSGISPAGSSTVGATAVAAANAILSDLGISFSVTNPTDVITGASASRTLDGLKIIINLTTLDQGASKLASILPASVTSNLPLPLPNAQVLTLDLGTVSVASDASPAFVASIQPSTAAPVTGNSGNSGSAGTPGNSTLGSSTSGNSGNSGSGSLGGSGGAGSGGSGGAGTGSVATIQPTSATSAVFGGIGLTLILLGLAAAAAMAYGYRRIDDLTELEGMDCVYADPQTNFTGGAPAPDIDAGGSGA